MGSGWGDTVVADVGLGGEAELLPVGVDRAAERASFGLRRVRRAEHLTAEVLPPWVRVRVRVRVRGSSIALRTLGWG